MSDASFEAAPYFREGQYLDKNGQMRAMVASSFAMVRVPW
jgi:hypothetical protein